MTACMRTWAASVALLLVLGSIGCGRGRLPRPPPAPPRAAAASVRSRALSVGGKSPTQGDLLASAPPTNVVICVLDAARADHFGCYGYPRDTTPNIDQLARESVLFRDHFSTCTATRPSTASLFTGLYPDTHRLGTVRISDEGLPTLARTLREAGWRTGLFSSNTQVTRELGLGAGFEHAFPPPDRLRSSQEAGGARADLSWATPEVLTREFARWLDESRGSGRRSFAYLHFLPPHRPYAAPRYFTRLVARGGRASAPESIGASSSSRRVPAQQWVDLYDGNLRWGDWGIGEVARLLRTRGLLDTTLLIVTADHGEAFGEHNYLWHGEVVYDECLHIPLLLRFPGRQRLTGDVAALTQTVDLLPTICELSRVRSPQVQGRSLLPLVGGRREIHKYAFAVATGGHWPYVVRSTKWALFLTQAGGARELYDVAHDPAESRNVYDSNPRAVAQLTAAFRAFALTQKRSLAGYLSSEGAAPPPRARPGAALSERTRRELRALGYTD